MIIHGFRSCRVTGAMGLADSRAISIMLPWTWGGRTLSRAGTDQLAMTVMINSGTVLPSCSANGQRPLKSEIPSAVGRVTPPGHSGIGLRPCVPLVNQAGTGARRTVEVP